MGFRREFRAAVHPGPEPEPGNRARRRNQRCPPHPHRGRLPGAYLRIRKAVHDHVSGLGPGYLQEPRLPLGAPPGSPLPAPGLPGKGQLAEDCIHLFPHPVRNHDGERGLQFIGPVHWRHHDPDGAHRRPGGKRHCPGGTGPGPGLRLHVRRLQDGAPARHPPGNAGFPHHQ